jgi:hypothetical protein
MTKHAITTAEKTRENRIRRKARRRGLTLSKSRRLDTGALDYGKYALLDHRTGKPVTPLIAGEFTHSQTLDQIEAWLDRKGS